MHRAASAAAARVDSSVDGGGIKGLAISFCAELPRIEDGSEASVFWAEGLGQLPRLR